MSGTIFTHRRPVSMESIHRGDNETFLLRRERVLTREVTKTHRKRGVNPTRFTFGFLERILGHFSRCPCKRKRKTKKRRKNPTIELLPYPPQNFSILVNKFTGNFFPQPRITFIVTLKRRSRDRRSNDYSSFVQDIYIYSSKKLNR